MNVMNDILEFLPKYPNTDKFEDDIMNPYEDDFYKSIFLKKEYNELRLDKVEQFPTKRGELFKHQKLLARFLSSYTLYDQMLVVHEMGTGKTCSAIAVIEQIRNETNNFKGALYLAKGSALINNFIDELIFKCTDGKYIPDRFSELTELEKVHRKKKMINDYYNWGTFEIFAKEIIRSSDQELINKYSNHIIIVDEIHNIRIQKKEDDKIKLYKQFWRFLHVVKDCKIVLLSGTPMKDGVEEIASVMNLILPENKQLPIGEEFIESFFNQEGEELFSIKEEKRPVLYELFKGRVSYLKAMSSDVKRVYEGSKIGNLLEFNVYQDEMSEFQTMYYLQALKLDKDERKGIYTKSRQASLFVYPDGSYGEEGYSKYIIETKPEKSKLKKMKGDSSRSFALSPGLISAIKGSDNEETLQKLRNFSSKYADSIRKILQAREDGKLVFIYNEYVQGSGLVLFGKILELFGFSKATGNEAIGSEQPRYASLTNLTATTKQLKALVDRYNQPDNVNGKIINVIMGSRKIAEGFSLRNVQVEDIHTPWFNYSETSQAIARGIRVGSHNQLFEMDVNVVVQIYQRVSIPKGGKESIDLQMYEIAEHKDVSIKKVERIIKESAWDCSFTYNRNLVLGQDGNRDCDYQSCDYDCIGVPKELMLSDDHMLDLSTYQIYYSDTISELTRVLRDIFKNRFNISYNEIVHLFSDRYTSFEILSALQKITNNNVKFINKYGFTSYLREDSNIYFLIDSLSVKGNYLSEYYVQFPSLQEDKSFTEIFDDIYNKAIPELVSKMCNSENTEDIRLILNTFSKEFKEYILESALKAEVLNITHNREIRESILEYFKGYFAEINGVLVSWFLYEDLGNIRCLNDGEFIDCDDYAEQVEEHLKNIQSVLETNPYGVYGQYNKTSKDFCIRDVREEIPEKANEIKSGKRCNNWQSPDLNNLIINHLRLPIPGNLSPKDLKKYNEIEELVSEGNNKKIFSHAHKKISKEYPKLKLPVPFFDLDNDEMCRILFWLKLSNNDKCEYLKEWFRSNNLLQDDDQCGVSGKIKKK